ncbi:hypothetical protein PIROE2DRAFT_10885 [Piromyces sp. E2]|nr:hypothetical protein PIROE2DRAFT_10885 [Piromyces sp. E2]|eukprot:OUM62732.1 hypothetical protein PIROE2DRAFT_10885 [Piromyces sp. E2]
MTTTTVIDSDLQSLIQNNDLTQLKITLDTPRDISFYIQVLLYAINNDASVEVVDLLLNYTDYHAFFKAIPLPDQDGLKRIFRKLIYHHNFLEDFIGFVKEHVTEPDLLKDLWNYFYTIALERNFYIIKFLLVYETKDSLDVINTIHRLFQKAIEKNQLVILRSLISKGINGRQLPRQRDSILYTTFKNGYIPMANLLLEKRVLTLTDEDLLDIVKLSIRNSNTKIVECLFKNNVRVNDLRDKYGYHPVHLAIRDKKIECVTYLLENGANVNEKTKDGLSPLQLAYDTHDRRIIETLIQHNADVNDVNTEGETILFLAVKDNDIDLVKCLINNNANLNVKDKDGNTPLMIASHERYFQIVRWLVKGGANINEKNKYHDTALYYSSPTYGYKKEIYNLLKVRGVS